MGDIQPYYAPPHVHVHCTCAFIVHYTSSVVSLHFHEEVVSVIQINYNIANVAYTGIHTCIYNAVYRYTHIHVHVHVSVHVHEYMYIIIHVQCTLRLRSIEMFPSSVILNYYRAHIMTRIIIGYIHVRTSCQKGPDEQA